MKIYLNSPKENWIVDRFVQEWTINNSFITCKNIKKSDIVWIISPWTWKRLPKSQIKKKKVLVTIHHIDEKKFNREDFESLDQYVDFYHVISKITQAKLQKITEKKIFYSPFWTNSNNWFEINNKMELKEKFDIRNEEFLIGSFQRDTEIDRKTPKLEKGPDNLLKIILDYKLLGKDIKVILSGTRRDYIINELNKNNIKFSYFEMISTKELNELYNILDLYVVSSRVEGGPAAIMEAALVKTPLISTDVGLASEILHSDSIFNMANHTSAIPNVDYAYQKAIQYNIPKGFEFYLGMFSEIYES
ncbi:glycosyltransferase [Acidimicrobiia bacterium]|nr:glycosyltransferase [Acidimicrobiia bacterium]